MASVGKSGDVSQDSTVEVSANASNDNATTRQAGEVDGAVIGEAVREIEAKKVHWYSYLKTRDFWTVLLIGQVLSLAITATNTFSTLLVNEGTSIPAFQTLFNYVLLTIIYLPIVLYKYGWRKYAQVWLHDWWKYFILSFMDVEGNYFTVLAYRYTNVLSAQLLNFWSIVCVVILSFLILRVRYKWAQVAGILICCGGMGILLASDSIQNINNYSPENKLKGDLFGLAGATLYGFSNVFEEWYVSRRPMYEVLSIMGIWGMVINGATAGIFDRTTIHEATWNGPVIGYIIGYTFALVIFYSLAPLILRMASAAFFDISLLTSNFWGTIIGIHVFGYTIYFLYPIAFVLIVVGLVIYFLAGSMLGDSKKPWLGANQEDGVAGFGTAKLKALNEARRRGLIADESRGSV